MDVGLVLQGGDTIRQLLKVAKKTVPKEEWRQTPVVLKATAGLRLLPEEKARALLDEVRQSSLSHSFALSPFPPYLRQFGRENECSAKRQGDVNRAVCKTEEKKEKERKRGAASALKAAVLGQSGVEGACLAFELLYFLPPQQPQMWFPTPPVTDNFAQN